MELEAAGDLVFAPEAILPPARSKPINKILRIFNEYVPGFFSPTDPPSGVQMDLPPMHFARGILTDMSPDEPIHVHARARGDIPSIDEAAKLSVVSGVCLFGEGGIKALGGEGKSFVFERPGISNRWGESPEVVAIERGPTQLYVPETICRLGRIAIALIQYAQAHDKSTDAFVHIPGPEYKLHAEVLFANGRMRLEALQQYYALIDDEVSSIENYFTDLFESFEVEAPRFGSPLAHAINGAEAGELSEVLAFDPSLKRIQSVLGIMAMSYIGPYMQASRPEDILPIFVENHIEEKIFENVKKIRGFKGIALYPLPICISRQNRSLLYHKGASALEIAKATEPWLLSNSR